VRNTETSVGSSSEVNSPVSFKPMKNKESTIEELNEIVKNLDLGEPSGMVFNVKIDDISKEDFTTQTRSKRPS
jgi:hypothetical protein